MTAPVCCSLIAVLLCLSGYLRIVATCKQATAKPGECPPETSVKSACTSSCESDSNCPNNEKCCSSGCGHYCTAPYTVKPGQCPQATTPPVCAESCFHDGQCPATQKCCPTTCGHACSESLAQGSGQEQGSGQGSGPGSASVQAVGHGHGQGTGYNVINIINQSGHGSHGGKDHEQGSGKGGCGGKDKGKYRDKEKYRGKYLGCRGDH